jgi:hypothetical protein
MKIWRKFTRNLSMAASASIAVAALACGGGTTGSGGGPSGSACDSYFNAIYASNCSGTTPPADEVARVRGRFELACTAALALPGIGITAGGLNACANALNSAGCGADQLPACRFDKGTLATGASCVIDSQCVSGDCTAGSGSPDGGTLACGVCGAGFNCGNMTCPSNTTCVFQNNTQTCVPVTYGDTGAPCDNIQTQCKQGLICNRASNTCSAPAGAGAPCSIDQDCIPSLVCPAAPGAQSTCQNPGPVGTHCNYDSDCAKGLGCDESARVCASISFAAAGQPCGATVRCLVGSCPWPNGANAPGGACPAVIPDGQPCVDSDPTKTCDTFAQCTGGICRLDGTNACQ